MRPLSQLANVIARTSLVAALAVSLLGGCYEGPKKGTIPNGPGGPGQGKTGGPSEKKIGVALLDFFYLSEEAMRSPECYRGPSSLIEFRRAEAGERVKQLAALFKDQADAVSVTATEITLDDCLSGLWAIDQRAKTVLGFPTTQELAKKPAVHVRTIMWDEDVTRYYPGSVVLNEEWADVSALRMKGHKSILVVHQFFLTGSRRGYFDYWRRSSSYDRTYRPQTIDWPDLTPQGWQAALTSITTSTQDFWKWLEPKVGTR